ncbi:hypothetical protein IAI10_02575 [Clostridium sp. 19966]|uniref:hypothetical protein n=1 Tax=Clostridium sp. 19966 TaxID=2768166 RepID=UPI0028DDC32A|nr:hypothetical protein [Clostridium sp. 19966]MDT8715544.1 hypothetical protein [Clostridium sp. 19966]
MVLSENEAYLLALGYTFKKDNIRISLRETKIYDQGKIRDIYFIGDMEEAIALYKKYQKTYERRMSLRTKEFIDNSLIVKLAGK